MNLLHGDLTAAELAALPLAAIPVGDDRASDSSWHHGLALHDALVARSLHRWPFNGRPDFNFNAAP